MKFSARTVRLFVVVSGGLGLAWSCAFDNSLREYLDARFWMPFSKQAWHFEKPNVSRLDAPFAGMTKSAGASPLAKLRAAYQDLPQSSFEPAVTPPDPARLQDAFANARSDISLTPRDREEVDLLDAKFDMRSGEAQGAPGELLRSAQGKLQSFLRSARTPEFRSEARGWLAHIHYLLGEQTAAGKIYLDELNQAGSNLS
ncbi:MAG: hypothetical protein ABUS49_03690, partial [Acidobacteriota bacterium]